MNATVEGNYRDLLGDLLTVLPPFASVQELSLEDQARSVLSWAISVSLSAEPGSLVVGDPARCPNCDEPFASKRSPYCSEMCREESGLVRQFRSGVTSGAILDPIRQIALGQKLWRLLGGGLPLRVSLIPEKAFARLLKRNDGMCENCGLPAKHVDHIGTG